ncbi:hypothetical protein BGZ80_010479 [Entomortierella chlamydospora]|uniref:Uncharacterized protein n=1 Tax=Entomortierella chlamydospora TaxID=101097 RepID=A0A9P6MVA6_9FUNG|nr:hypothetical protein BGZ80_010479 [Entomortierella chlamydospora]
MGKGRGDENMYWPEYGDPLEPLFGNMAGVGDEDEVERDGIVAGPGPGPGPDTGPEFEPDTGSAPALR